MDGYRALYAQGRSRKRRTSRLIEPYRHKYAPPDPNVQTHGVLVSNAGVAEVNGQYVWDTDHYEKGIYLIVHLVDYPEAGTTSWLIHDGTNEFYVADDATQPWLTQFRVDTNGVAPTPTIELVPVKA
jgi:hypothetical protein